MKNIINMKYKSMITNVIARRYNISTAYIINRIQLHEKIMLTMTKPCITT